MIYARYERARMMKMAAGKHKGHCARVATAAAAAEKSTSLSRARRLIYLLGLGGGATIGATDALDDSLLGARSLPSFRPSPAIHLPLSCRPAWRRGCRSEGPRGYKRRPTPRANMSPLSVGIPSIRSAEQTVGKQQTRSAGKIGS